jgi:hypothetical protein
MCNCVPVYLCVHLCMCACVHRHMCYCVSLWHSVPVRAHGLGGRAGVTFL